MGSAEKLFDVEWREALKTRNEQILIMLQCTTRHNTANYLESRRRAKQITHVSTKEIFLKRDLLKRQVEEIEKLRSSNVTRNFYAAVKHINQGFQPKTGLCNGSNGNPRASVGSHTKM